MTIRTTTISTSAKTQVIDVTPQVIEMAQGVENGLAFCYIPHTTAALLLSEDDDELRADLVSVAKDWLADLRPFTHFRKNNPNTEAHVLSAFGGHGVTIAVEDGELDLGTYQTVLLLEMDGPKQRELRCKIIVG